MPKSLSHIYLCIVQGHQDKIRCLRHQEIPPPYCCLFVLYGEGSPLRLVWQSSAWVLCYPNYSNLVKIIWEGSLDLLSLLIYSLDLLLKLPPVLSTIISW